MGRSTMCGRDARTSLDKTSLWDMTTLRVFTCVDASVVRGASSVRARWARAYSHTCRWARESMRTVAGSHTRAFIPPLAASSMRVT